MSRTPFELPPDVETDAVAGVAVPTACRDRIDEDALRAAVDALAEFHVDRYVVSPVGGLKLRIGVHRPASAQEALRAALADAGHGLTDHGVADGFRRLRVDLVDPATR